MAPFIKFNLFEHFCVSFLEDPSSPSSSVQRNVTLFKGFCAMKYALYAVCVNAHTYTNFQDCELLQQMEAGQGEEPSEGDSSVVFLAFTMIKQHCLSKIKQCNLGLFHDQVNSLLFVFISQDALTCSSTSYLNVSCILKLFQHCSAWNSWRTSSPSSFFLTLTSTSKLI